VRLCGRLDQAFLPGVDHREVTMLLELRYPEHGYVDFVGTCFRSHTPPMLTSSGDYAESVEYVVLAVEVASNVSASVLRASRK
jgi:hypothetical protein